MCRSMYLTMRDALDTPNRRPGGYIARVIPLATALCQRASRLAIGHQLEDEGYTLRIRV